jgi:hypothetical protein
MMPLRSGEWSIEIPSLIVRQVCGLFAFSAPSSYVIQIPLANDSLNLLVAAIKSEPFDLTEDNADDLDRLAKEFQFQGLTKEVRWFFASLPQKQKQIATLRRQLHTSETTRCGSPPFLSSMITFRMEIRSHSDINHENVRYINLL